MTSKRIRDLVASLQAANLRDAPKDPAATAAYSAVLDRVLRDVSDEDLAHALQCWLEAEKWWPTPADLRGVATAAESARLALAEPDPTQDVATIMQWLGATGTYRMRELRAPWQITGDRDTDLRLSAAVQACGVYELLAAQAAVAERRLYDSLALAASARRALALADRDGPRRLDGPRVARRIEGGPRQPEEARGASWGHVGDAGGALADGLAEYRRGVQ